MKGFVVGFLFCLLLGGCQAPPLPDIHPEANRTALVRITKRGPVPKRVRVRGPVTLLFLNDRARSLGTVQFEASSALETRCGHGHGVTVRDGRVVTDPPLVGGDAAAFCFHLPGRYPYRVLSGEREILGEVLVLGAEE